MDGRRVRGSMGFSSLLKQKIKAKNCAVFCFAGKRKIFLFIYEVITWEKRKKKLCYSVVMVP
jgi:hypothetical protein